MRTILRIGACYLAMIFTLPVVVLAGDLLDGTWDLDIAASKYDPGPARRGDTRIYKIDGSTIHFTGTAVFADGKSFHVEYTGAYDGKDYPVAGNPRVGTIAQERVDAYTAKTTTKRDGKITATSVRVISKDGKTMTIKKVWLSMTLWSSTSEGQNQASDSFWPSHGWGIKRCDEKDHEYLRIGR
ncbi:MAG TPA: hypothetical protein VK525_15540 [Candidatus Saccharimonadales bacterium]|nr:hypothetical protein [Candidatus Saccharimonadales bacterium]